jgi:hypothetical protein
LVWLTNSKLELDHIAKKQRAAERAAAAAENKKKDDDTTDDTAVNTSLTNHTNAYSRY